MSSHTPVGPSLIESIRLVECFRHYKAGEHFTASSLPGHLLHLVVAGHAEQTSNGRRQTLIPGALVWYHEDEWVEGYVRKTPWVVYSVNFHAEALVPPDFECRMAQGNQRLLKRFTQLLEAWRKPPSGQRSFLCQSLLLALLADIRMPMAEAPSPKPMNGLWWEIESWGRRNIGEPVSMNEICLHFHCNAKTVARACHATLGMPPMKRLKRIRMSLARGLVRYSELQMSEIALRVGYRRVHEFSRDYRKIFGLAPTGDRRRWA